MSSELTLVMLATGGTAALVGAAFLMGFNKSGIIKNNEEAMAFVRAYAPSETPNSAILDPKSASAIVLCESGTIFHVTMMGLDPSVRKLHVGEVEQISDGQITINPKDFGFPKRTFRADPKQLNAVLDVLKQGPRQ